MANPSLQCPNCNEWSAPDAHFCIHCGHALPRACQHCGSPLQGYETFCTVCGQRVTTPSKPSVVHCSSCEHYREAVTPSNLLTVNTSASDVAEALVKIKEEEVKVRDEEAKILIERLKVDAKEWGLKPLMHAYCGEHENDEIYEVERVKNRDGHCASFTMRKTTAPTECVKCIHRSVPPDQLQQRCQHVLDPKLYADCVSAVYKNYGLEVLEGWFGKGLLPHLPSFQKTCMAYSGAGTFALCEYFNMRGRCPRYEPAPQYAGAAL